MTIGKQLAQCAAYSTTTAAAVGLCLWILLGLLHIDRNTGCEHSGCPAPEPVAVPQPAPVIIPEPKPEEPGIAGGPGDSGPLVTRMQGALIKKGYSAGPAGADGNFNDDTLTALQAFQDANALPVQRTCDRQCWNALAAPQ